MKINLLTFYLFLLLICGFAENTYAQDERWWKEKKYKTESVRQKYDLCKKTFKDIASGFTFRNVNFINLYFDSQVYLNIISNEKGYYSSSQSELILDDFMDYFTIQSFTYSRSNRYSNYAFAVGKYSYNKGMGKRTLDVSVSLRYKNNRWYIDQININ